MFVCSCLPSKPVKNIETTLEIEFQDFFKDDKVSLKFNECTVLTDVVVNSNESTGLSSVRLKIYKKGKAYQISYADSSINCKKNNDEIEIAVILNGKGNKYVIDVSNGKFIGFSKKSETELFFLQSKMPFEYN
jgi:hypothetical protein